jgi:N utilization substance protein A
VDIIRWSEDQKQLLTEALAPAKIVEISLNDLQKKALVVVEDDQLALAIGKKGQNVRLACKLTGWDIDIRSHSELQKEQSAKDAADKIGISELTGVGPKTKANLQTAGYINMSQVAEATVDQLSNVPGIGAKTAEKLIQGAKELVKSVATPKRQVERMLGWLPTKEETKGSETKSI